MDTCRRAPHRRGLLLWGVPALLVLAVLSLVLPGRDSGSPPRPDILLVVWDTCRGDRVGVGGYTPDTTPFLDGLAADGVAFRRCYTTAPWTPPAHASMFTGLLPRHHGLIEGMGDRMRAGLVPLPVSLREAGYETVCVSANPLISDATGLNAGFERELPCYRTGDDAVTGEDALAGVTEWLGERRARGGERRPFFLFVNLMDCHLPYVYDAAAVEAVHGEGAKERARRAAGTIGDMEAKHHLMGVRPLEPERILDLGLAYDGAVRRVDGITGRLLDLLRDAGLSRDALVVVCSDHGENLGEHGEMGHGFSLHDTVCLVPLVVSRPGAFEGGVVVEGPVSLMDLHPTLLAAAGVASPPGCGLDAVPLSLHPPDRVVLSEFGPMPLSRGEAAAAMPGAPRGTLDRFGYRYRAARRWGPGGGGRTWIGVESVAEDGSTTPVREALFDPDGDPGALRNLLGPGEDPREREAAGALRRAAESR